MKRSLTAVIATAIAAAVCLPSEASRRFTGGEYLSYDTGGPPIVDGLTVFGASWWMKRTGGSIDQVIDNVDASGYGLSVSLHGSKLFVNYTGQAALGGRTRSLTAIAIIWGAEDPPWLHLAVDINLRDARPTMRVFINGILQMQATSPVPLAPMQGASILTVGGSPGTTGFVGELHDVCMIDRRWTTSELLAMSPDMLTLPVSARDAVTSPDHVLFNPRLRSTVADPFSGVEPIIAGEEEPRRGVGPRITYADQLPTVLVIGDTQGLTMPNTTQPGRMAKLGQFVVDYRDTLNIAAVLHCGDWVQRGENPDQLYEASTLAHKLNEAEVPWSFTLGNHDYFTVDDPQVPDPGLWYDYVPPCLVNPIADDDCELWNPPDCDGCTPACCETGTSPPCCAGADLDDLDWWSAHSPLTMSHDQFGCGITRQDAAFAHAFEFVLGAERQIVVSLPFAFSEDSLCWTHEVAAANPDARIWIVTHAFLDDDGHILHSTGPYNVTWEVAPDDAWDTGVPGAQIPPLRDIENLGFVVCGHATPPFDDVHDLDETEWHYSNYFAHHECRDRSADDLGVHQLIVNAQAHRSWLDQDPEHAGAGFMQILAFDDAAGQVHAESYVPLIDEYRTELGDQHTFTLEVDAPCIDCNGNGIPDGQEDLPDCDFNGVLDECEDCNGNGVPDHCETQGFAGCLQCPPHTQALDCNDNGIPDECEQDCNSNGIPDDCDIASGTSGDANGDGIPDECEVDP